MSQELITVELPEVRQEADFRLLSQCVCLFRSGDRGCVFLSSVQSFKLDDSFLALTLHRPKEAACESRRAFRIPVLKQLPDVELIDENGEILRFAAVDMSLSGSLVESLGEEGPDLSVGSRFKASFRLEELTVSLAVEVRRKYGKRYGLFFTDILDEEELKPPPELSEMLHRLEQIWLESKQSESV